MYSGLIFDDITGEKSIWGILKNKKRIKSNYKKIKKLPKHIADKILELPQYEIFFKGGIPYYKDSKSNIEKELPKRDGNGFYYDPVEDTEAYRLVIDDVKISAMNEYEKQMYEQYGSMPVLGGEHFYYTIEADILYKKYGITCINNPMKFNDMLLD